MTINITITEYKKLIHAFEKYKLIIKALPHIKHIMLKCAVSDCDYKELRVAVETIDTILEN